MPRDFKIGRVEFLGLYFLGILIMGDDLCSNLGCVYDNFLLVNLNIVI